MCAKFGVDRVSLRSYSVSKFRPSNLQKNISDLASQHQEHVCQVWGRSEVSLRSYSVSKFCKSNLQKNIWPGQSTPRTCAPSLGSIGFPWGVTAFQSFVNRIYEQIYLTWPVNAKNMCAKFGVDRVSLRSYSVSKFRPSNLQKNISDLASQHQEHVCQVWGRSEVSLRSYSVSKFCKSNLQKNIWPGQSTPRTCAPSLGSIGFPWGVTAFQSFFHRIYKKIYLTWPVNAKNMCAKFGVDRVSLRSYSVSKFRQSNLQIIYLTWPVNAKNMCAKFGVDRRFPWGVTAFQSFVNRIYKKISDLASQRQEHVRQVWGRSGFPEELQRFKVSSIEFTKKYIWPGQSTPRTCVPSLGSIGGFPEE